MFAIIKMSPTASAAAGMTSPDEAITSQTSAGTTATAGSIGNLAELAAEMQRSVEGFKLPDTGAGAVQVAPAATARRKEKPAAALQRDKQPRHHEQLPA